MIFKFLILCSLIMITPLAVHAQFIGNGISIPGMSLRGVGGGIVISSNGIADDSAHLLQDDSGHFLTVG